MNHIHRPRRYVGAALAGAAALVLGVALPASASADRAVVEHWVDDVTVVHPDGSPDFCGDLGFDVVEHVQASGVYVGTPRGRDGLWYAGARFTGTTSWSNPDTGREYRNEFSGTDRDQVVTDNGDGTLTIQVQLTGPDRYYVDGALAFIDTGMVRFSILIDHAGTPSSPDDDEFVEFLGLDTVTGLRHTDGRDFCADLVEFIG